MLFTLSLRPLSTGLACVLALCAIAPTAWAANDAATAKLLRGLLASVTPVATPSEVAPRPTQSTPEERKRWVKYP